MIYIFFIVTGFLIVKICGLKCFKKNQSHIITIIILWLNSIHKKYTLHPIYNIISYKIIQWITSLHRSSILITNSFTLERPQKQEIIPFCVSKSPYWTAEIREWSFVCYIYILLRHLIDWSYFIFRFIWVKLSLVCFSGYMFWNEIKSVHLWNFKQLVLLLHLLNHNLLWSDINLVVWITHFGSDKMLLSFSVGKIAMKIGFRTIKKLSYYLMAIGD